MGLFDFLKSKGINNVTAPDTLKIDYKTSLDQIEKSIFTTLKPLGFKKKGRTFNREIGKDIFQVINFQAGPYPIGSNYVVPGFRENLYGKFTINLGVCIKSLYKLSDPAANKTFYKEYECQIRIRLGQLLKERDHWWKIGNDVDDTIEEIKKGILTVGSKWFEGADSKEKIVENLGVSPYNFSPRAKLDAALIVWLNDKERGAELFNIYLTLKVQI